MVVVVVVVVVAGGGAQKEWWGGGGGGETRAAAVNPMEDGLRLECGGVGNRRHDNTGRAAE